MISKNKLIEILQNESIENIESVNARDYNTENGYIIINTKEIVFDKGLYIKSTKEKIQNFKDYTSILEQKLQEVEGKENE